MPARWILGIALIFVLLAATVHLAFIRPKERADIARQQAVKLAATKSRSLNETRLKMFSSSGHIQGIARHINDLAIAHGLQVREIVYTSLPAISTSISALRMQIHAAEEFSKIDSFIFDALEKFPTVSIENLKIEQITNSRELRVLLMLRIYGVQ